VLTNPFAQRLAYALTDLREMGILQSFPGWR